MTEDCAPSTEEGSSPRGGREDDHQGTKAPRWKIPIFLRIVEPSVVVQDVEAALRRHRGLKIIEIWRGKPAATKAAALHDVLETKGVSYEWRKPFKCLCH